MTILNLLWGFVTGGVSNCFLIYDRLGSVNPNLKVVSVCILRPASTGDLQPLYDQNIKTIFIKSYFDLSWTLKLKRIIQEEQVDCLFSHAHNGPMMLYLARLLHVIRLPLITTIHGYYPTPRKDVEFVWMRYLRQDWVKKIIFVDQITPTIIQSKGVQKEKMAVVHNGIDKNVPCIDDDDHPLLMNPGISIVSASRLVDLKGLNYLIEALGLLNQRGYGFHYYCIGDGPEYQSLRNLVSSLRIDDKVSFVGYQRNVASWLENCDIYVLPSLFEAHSLAILEAMRAKKAIVATDVGGNPESIRNEIDGLLVPSKDPIALADALQKMIESEELRIKLGTNAYERFLNGFTIDTMMKNLASEILKTDLN